MNVSDQFYTDEVPSPGALNSLTFKQREVLDLLIEYKTSKEISKILLISPHTVDQRVDAAKTKLGAASRSEVAQIYRRLLGRTAPIYEQLTYEDSYVADPPVSLHNQRNAGIAATPFSDLMAEHGGAAVLVGSESDYRVVPELFDGRWGTVARLVTILAITILLCIAFLGGLTILMEMSTLMRR